MSIDKAIAAGLAGNEVSKKITGMDDVSTGRTVVATGVGATIGAVTAGAVTVGATAVGIAAAPVTVPLAVGGAVVGFISSLFD
ncbi:hypothetical protein BCU19_22630 (plasmid) [Vibrio cyclitrophicus]|uniref:hypothetical protein n=1 Tax=Vibrio cyclitrophicus TaxID=47951 RepID=UPI000C82E304|nr:hypothetical protein [Vibrio cyclitrophicus]PMJ54188.1 hypothetical protein BCU19_18530 [Vibrio cyclitrophicus]